MKKTTIITVIILHATNLLAMNTTTSLNTVSSPTTLSTLEDIAKQLLPICKTMIQELQTSQQDDKGKSSSVTQHTDESQTMHILQQLNPTLYNFGINNDMTSDEIIMLNQLSQTFHITPEAAVQFIKDHHDVTQPHIQDSITQKYQDMHTNNTPEWQTVALSILKKVIDDAKGTSPNTSPLQNIHINTLHQQVTEHENTISENQNTIQNRNWALGGTSLTAAIGMILTLVSQLYGCFNHSGSTPLNNTLH